MAQHRNSLVSIIAYVAPFVVFVGLTLLESSGGLGLPYDSATVYQAIYTVKTLLVAAALWKFRREYPPFSTKGFGLAIVAGCLGCALWIALARLQSMFPELERLIDAIQQGHRSGYDPFSSGETAARRTAFIAIRLIGLALVVPVMEEVFWRGFLARYLAADDFRSVPQGIMTPRVFLIVTLAFASVHPEVLAALAWGAMINVLYQQTANLWACVAMHAVTNGLLGVYILATGNWQLW